MAKTNEIKVKSLLAADGIMCKDLQHPLQKTFPSQHILMQIILLFHLLKAMHSLETIKHIFQHVIIVQVKQYHTHSVCISRQLNVTIT